MNTRPILNFPTPKATWIPRRGGPSPSPLDLLIFLAVAAVIATTLFWL
jgi:hypothetical protein